MRVFQSIDEFLNITYDYVDKHGPFTEESYEKWLDTQLGEVDWDRLERYSKCTKI